MLATHALAAGRVAIELLAPNRELGYRPRAVLEPFRVAERREYPLGAIARAHDAVHHHDALESVDPDSKLVRTAAGHKIAYDALLIAVGARMTPGPPGMVTFSDEDVDRFAEVVDDVRAARADRLAFVVPPGSTWSLPLYELALMTSYEARVPDAPRLRLTLITPEDEPLALFGHRAAGAVARLLQERAIEIRAGAYVDEVRDAGGEASELALRPGGERLTFDRVITLPRLGGPRILGLPSDPEGFIPTDDHGAVAGVDGCFAAGDATSFPVKQGGIATQQADAAAEAIAAVAGAEVEPRPFRPVLRGLLITSAEPRYLRQAISGGEGETSIASSHLLWWPSAKIAGRFLAPYLARVDASLETAVEPSGPDVVSIDVELRDL